MANLTKEDIERAVIDVVRTEKQTWEDAVWFYTDKVGFAMRPFIRKLRKNYYGTFDEPVDPITGREKIWIHLTQEFCDSMRKSTDLDTKDINFRARHPDAIGKTKAVKALFSHYMDTTDFGRDLDEFITDKVINGTAVWLTTKEYDKELKRTTAKRTRVDLLNIYIDPTAHSIQEAYRFTTRSLMTESEIKSHKDWINTDEVQGSFNLNPIDSSVKGNNSGRSTKLVDVWRMHGKAPKSVITGVKEDTEEIDVELIVSGLDSPGKETVHLVQGYDGKKPYEEDWLWRVPGRWYGMGVPEKLFWYQMWANSVVNIRINRAYVAQLGIFQVRKGSGITPAMMSRLASMGAIEVSKINEDIMQLPMQEASQSSYQDEEVIQTRSMRVTGLYEAATGESLPSSTPATNAAIQNNAAQSGASLLKEGTGEFLERWVRRQALPIVLGSYKVGEMVRLELDPDQLRALDDHQINTQLVDQVNQIHQSGGFVDPEQVNQERLRGLSSLQAMGSDRYLKLEEAFKDIDFDVQVFVTNEKIDKGVLSQNLLTAIQFAPEYKDQILQSAFDLWGVDIKMNQQPQMPMPQQGMQPGQPPQPGVPPVPSQDPQVAFTNANTMNNG